MASTILEAIGPDGAKLFACVDPAARYVTPAVASSRFSASLNPFPDEATAQVALRAAGAETTSTDSATGRRKAGAK